MTPEMEARYRRAREACRGLSRGRTGPVTSGSSFLSSLKERLLDSLNDLFLLVAFIQKRYLLILHFV